MTLARLFHIGDVVLTDHSGRITRHTITRITLMQSQTGIGFIVSPMIPKSSGGLVDSSWFWMPQQREHVEMSFIEEIVVKLLNDDLENEIPPMDIGMRCNLNVRVINNIAKRYRSPTATEAAAILKHYGYELTVASTVKKRG